MNTPQKSSNNYSSVEFSNEEATTSGMVPNFDSAKPSTSKYGLLDQDDYSSDEYSNEEGKDDVYDRPSNSNSSNEEDGDCLGMREKFEELALLKPGTSGMVPNFYSAKLPIPNETLFGHIDQDESSDDMSYHFSSANKRSNEDHAYYPSKRLKEEDPELDEPSTSGISSTRRVESSTLNENQDKSSVNELRSDRYSVKGSAPKDTLHGHTYQLRLLMLFVLRIPDEQEFCLATEMSEAKGFDDIVLKYRGRNDHKWRYRFLQAKHRHDDEKKISRNALFQNKDKDFLLKEYFKYYCHIRQNNEFEGADLEEFLICTNIDFNDKAKAYFDPVEENDSILLNFNEINGKDAAPVKYKLNEETISEKEKKIVINDQNENLFRNFVEKFRFLPNYKDVVLNKNIEYCLKKYLKIENVVLPYGDLQKRVLDWFESYDKNTSKFWKFEDKKKFLESININIDSLLIAGYSTFYAVELNNYENVFNDISSLDKFIGQKRSKIMFIITSTPKLSVIKLNQVFNELKLKQDEFILTDEDKLRSNKKISTTFFAAESYKWLAVEYQNEIEMDEILDAILKTDKEKRIVIIGREDDVLKFRQYLTFDTCFYDKTNSFENLTPKSQEKILERKIVFQGNNINLNELIDINSGEKIIDEHILEKILTKTMKIGNNDAFESDFLIEDYYMERKLIRREFLLDILQNVEILKKYLFIISGVNKDLLKNLSINNELIFVWEDGKSFENGIIISEETKSGYIFEKLCENNTKNVYWLKYIKEEFLIMNFRKGTDIFNKPVICFEEHELNEKQILDEKILIVADGPGCGKSTFLTKVARQLKQQKMSNIWILRINLSSYAYKQEGRKQVMKSLEDIKFKDSETKKATEFMAHLLFPQENESENKHFVRELFIQSLVCLNENMKFPEIILLFDGFDEISPTFKEKTLTLLQALRKSNVTQMWITTRNHEEQRLKNDLHSSSVSLRRLDEEEKIDFLEKLWKYNLEHFDDIKLKPDGEGILTYLKEITNNICNCDKEDIKDSFRYFQNHLLPNLRDYEVEHLLSNVDFSVIAEHLINYFENDDKMSEFTDNPLQIKMLAEIIFFKKFNSLDNLDIFSLYEEFINYKLRVFRDDKDAAGKSVAGRGFFETHLKYLTTVHQEIALQTLFPHYDNIQFGEVIDKIELTRAGLLVIHDGRLEFVHRSFAEYFVSLHFAEHLHDQNVQKIVFSVVLINENYSLIRKFLNNNEKFLGKLGSKTQQMNEIIRANYSISLSQMLKKNLYNLFMKFLEKLPLDLSENLILFNENNEGTTVLHMIFEYIKDEQIVENLLKAIKENVSLETLQKLLSKKDKRERTALHCINFYRKNSIVKKKLQFIKLNCDTKLFDELLLQVNERGETVLHRACEYGHDITYLLEVSDENENTIRDLLLKIDNDGRTALFNTIYYPYNSSLLTTLLKLIKSVCNSEEINNLFTIKIDSKNLLHTACDKMDKDMLVIFLNGIEDNQEIIKTLLLDTDKDGLSPLLYTVHDDFDFDMLKIILDEQLFKLDITKFNILHHFCRQNSVNNLILLLNKIKDNPEILNKFLLQTDKEGNTALHYAVLNHVNPSMMSALLNFVKPNCEKEIFKRLLCEANNEGLNVLHVACMRIEGKTEYEDHLKYLLKFIKDDDTIINKLLLKTCKNHGCTPLHYTVRDFDNASLLKILFNFIKNYDSTMLDTLLLKETNTGCSLLHFACKHSNEENLKYLLFAMQNNITLRDKLILKADHNGQTILHYSVDNFQMLKLFLDFVKSQCDQEIFTNLILKCDQEDRTGLHTFCQNSHNEEILTYLLSLVKKNTTDKVFNLFLFKKDYHGKMASDYIACNINNFPLLEVLSYFGVPLTKILDNSRLIQ